MSETETIAHADQLLLLYGSTMFAIGYVITIFTHSLWFAAALAYVWWFQNTVLAKFRAPEIITTRQSDIFVYAPLCLLFGVAMALSLLWIFGTSTVALLSVDAWRVIAPNGSSNSASKQTVLRLTNWATIGFMLAVLTIAISLNFLTAEFSPDLIANENLSVIFGILLLIGGVLVIILEYVQWYLEGTRSRSLTPRFNILYSLLFLGWLVLPALTYHLINAANPIWRFIATELVLTVLLIVTIIAERPYVTLSRAYEQETDIRYVAASKMAMQKHVLRWSLLIWFPLTILYIASSVAQRLSTLATALLIFTATTFFIAVLFTIFLARSAFSSNGSSSSSSSRTSGANKRIDTTDDSRPPLLSPQSAAGAPQQQKRFIGSQPPAATTIAPNISRNFAQNTNELFAALEV